MTASLKSRGNRNAKRAAFRVGRLPASAFVCNEAGFCIAYDCTCTSICGNGITMPFSSKARFTPSLMSKNTSQ